ncbi:thiol reductant ABC exporter subunit CydD [Nocardia yamanashiensis]|uniref:thiol reductant ABC exporter subunit CydD n=1 Tax=Nocardia yamanashiensis TaxID=209247 RepID=UPI001E5A221A|nr:thiol reductant ABC exporter subunit CydD [Nocardia yamanashiensis]UGT39915.1 thiol reductant ABC exporter subunit CydD [Nocardia yamanashiensis]
MGRPIDPRLWRYAHSARRYLGLSVALSLLTTVCIVVAALALASVLAGVITDPGRRDIGSWTTELVALAIAVAVRVAATWWQSRLAHRAGAQVVAELESAVVAAGAQLPPRELERRRTELAVVAGSGLNGLRGYLAGYLPALLLSVLVPPIVLTVIALHDWVSGAIILVTLPLIPIFMILIGLLTQGRAKDTLTATTRLSDQLLDLFTGMPTLRALGRETGRANALPEDDSAASAENRGMAGRVRALGDDLHRRTMSALRMAFLSSMVLEMLATLCVALVAVSIGMRLVFGNMGLYAGLLALILAPEVYLPLRAVGERFHASQDGMAAAEKAFAVLDPDDAGARPITADPTATAAGHLARRTAPGPRPGNLTTGDLTTPRPTAAGARSTAPVSGAAEQQPNGSGIAEGGPVGDRSMNGRIEIRDLTVDGRDGAAPAGLSAILRPGAVSVLTGPNGCGKSTALQVILGLLPSDRGIVTIDGTPLSDLDLDAWWSHVAWLPQRPVLVPGTLRANLELLGAPAGSDEIASACAATGFDHVLAELPDGWNTTVGAGGLGLSLGQRQRLALTRTLAAPRQVLLLDEPTAHLDDACEATVLAALVARARAGATVVLVGHRPSVLAVADHIVEVRGTTAEATDEEPDPAPRREPAVTECHGGVAEEDSDPALPLEPAMARENPAPATRRPEARAWNSTVPVGIPPAASAAPIGELGGTALAGGRGDGRSGRLDSGVRYEESGR